MSDFFKKTCRSIKRYGGGIATGTGALFVFLGKGIQDDNSCNRVIRIGGFALGGYGVYKLINTLSNTCDTITSTVADTALYRAQCEADAKLYREKCKADAQYKVRNHQAEVPPPTPPETVSTSTDEQPQIRSDFDFPVTVGILDEVLDGCPEELKPAFLLAFLSECGALMFSKCRAMYLDGKLHSPNLMVVVEGQSGIGKGGFKTAFDHYFQRVIESDKQKLSSPTEDGIAQTISSDVSEARLTELLANGGGTHLLLFESECASLVYNLRDRSKGLRVDHLLKAFDNDEWDHLVKSKASGKQGRFNIFLNAVITGTPISIKELVSTKNLEGGLATRLSFVQVKLQGRQIPAIEYPTPERMEEIKDLIDQQRALYCYKTDVSGKDTPCAETVIELDYVNLALEKWLEEQKHLAENENNHARFNCCRRIACQAFRYAIVIHMLYKQHTDEPESCGVTDIVIYIADLLMRNFLYHFGEQWNKLHEGEPVGYGKGVASDASSAPTSSTHQDAEKRVLELHLLPDMENGQKKWGYKNIAREVGWFTADGQPDKERVRYFLNKHADKH